MTKAYMTIDSGPNASDGTRGTEPQARAEPVTKGWADMDRREALTKIGALASAAPAMVVLLSASPARAQPQNPNPPCTGSPNPCGPPPGSGGPGGPGPGP